MQFAMAGQDQRVLCIKRGIAVSRCPLAGCKIALIGADRLSALSCLRHTNKAQYGQPKGFGPVYREPGLMPGFFISVWHHPSSDLH